MPLITGHAFTPTASGCCAHCVAQPAQHASEQARVDAEQHSRSEEFRKRTEALGGDSIAAANALMFEALFPQRKERT